MVNPLTTNNKSENIFINTPLYWWWKNIDHISFSLVFILLLIGITLTFGSSAPASARIGYADPFYFVYRQVAFGIISSTLLLGLSMLSLDSVRRFSIVIYIIAFVLLVSILGFGHSAKGAQRWLRIGGFSLQPSEMIKPAAIVLVSWILSRRIYDKSLSAELIAVIIVILPISIFVLQPDIGQTILLSLSFFTIFWISGMSFKWYFGLVGSFFLGITTIYMFMPHFVTRINKFLDPNHNDNYQVEKGLEAIASGHIFGRGAGEGVVKYSLPDAHTDFIFSLATEEWGLIGALFLISLFAILIIRGIHVASKNPEPFAQIAGIGMYVLLGMQVGINLAVNMNLIPAKGMTLPFISYGGSSLLGTAITMGFALALTRKRPTEIIMRKNMNL